MNRTTKRFIGTFAILIVLMLVLYLISSGLFNQKKSNLVLSNIKKETINKLVLIDNQKTVTLIKNNNSWSINTAGQVDQSKINTLIDSILVINKDDLVSTNKVKQAQLGIGAKKVEIYSGKSKTVIVYGKNFDLNKIYFAIEGEEKTYATDNKIEDYFSPEFLIINKDQLSPTITPTN